MIELVKAMLKKINLSALQSAAQDLSIPCEIDQNTENIDDLSTNEEYLKKIHHLLFEVHVMNGFLICPESGRKFTVKDSIPNMLLNEDEI